MFTRTLITDTICITNMTRWSANELESKGHVVASNELEQMDQHHRQQELQNVSDHFLNLVEHQTNFQARQDIESEQARRAKDRMAELHDRSQNPLMDDNNLIDDPYELDLGPDLGDELGSSPSSKPDLEYPEYFDQYEPPLNQISEDVVLPSDKSYEELVDEVSQEIQSSDFDLDDIDWDDLDLSEGSDTAENADDSERSNSSSSSGGGTVFWAVVGGAVGSVGGPAGTAGGAAIGGLIGSLFD